MGLIRNAAILAVAITLIPADPHDRAQLYVKAQEGVDWASTFCDRNRQTCLHGAELRDAFLEKAAFAASSAYEIALVQLTGEPGEDRMQAVLRTSSPRRYTRDTLTQYDRQTEWRGHR